jgi:hypothetical protein
MSAVRTATDSGLESRRGVPQGLSISGALAALYMIRLDRTAKDMGFTYFRYVDDILFVCEQKEAELLLKEFSKKLRARGLLVHPKGVAGKTEISDVSKGIDFLGYSICPEKISIRKSSYNRMFKNILKVLTNFRYRKNVRRTLFKLNLKISGCIVGGGRRGWTMFFSYSENASQLAYLDRFVQKQLKRVGFPKESLINVKKFIKSYHEIRNNLNATRYIPNFDEYDDEKKREVIVTLTSHSEKEVMSWSSELLDSEFKAVISQEVNDLERDVGSFS